MDIVVCVHVDQTEEGMFFWAEVDDVAGFYVAADSVTAIQRRAEDALRDFFVDEGESVGRIRFRLASSSLVNETRVDYLGAAVPAHQPAERTVDQIALASA